MSKNNSFGKNRILYATKQELSIAVALGALNIVILAVAAMVSQISVAAVAAVLVCLYLIEVAVIGLKHSETVEIADCENIHGLLSESGSVVLKNLRAPVIAVDRTGKVLWMNAAMSDIIPVLDNPIGKDVSYVFDVEAPENFFNEQFVKVGSKLYRTEGFVVSEHDEGLYLTMLTDVTELSALEKRYNEDRVAVAYIAIDNVEDVLQYIHEKFRDAVTVVDDKLKEWAASVNGIIKSYDNDKYIMLFDSQYLDKCIENRFAILDEIRDTRVGDGISVTVSIGVSRIDGSLAEREAAARDAIDMALQRGGDQAVYRTESSTEYYGGRTKAVYKRSNVRSRTFATQLASLMARADNVIVMGHRYGDFDSFGASVGIARLCMLCGVKANIAVDMRDKNLEPCIQLLQNTETYAQVFVDNAEGLDLLGPDTLVILVDHNNLKRAQFADIASKVEAIAVIDHHRTTEALPPVVKLSYIEPSASSCCELVSEMLENAISSQNLIKEVADMLLAGILLDTKQFTRNTGTRTFGAAQYLRGAGASPVDVYNLFKTDPEELSREARFHTSITTYNGNISISCCDGDTDESYRIIASKAADKMLSLRGIDAAFALVRIGDEIHISGRSNGTVNVQLILEKLNGGGHFDVAGAQVRSESIEEVLGALKASIDEYLAM